MRPVHVNDVGADGDMDGDRDLEPRRRASTLMLAYGADCASWR